MESDLPFRFDYNEVPKPQIDDFSMYVFPQVLGSTAVFVPMTCNQKCFVYFAGRFAYAVPYSEVLMQDIRDRNVESINGAGKYIKAAKEEGRAE